MAHKSSYLAVGPSVASDAEYCVHEKIHMLIDRYFSFNNTGDITVESF